MNGNRITKSAIIMNDGSEQIACKADGRPYAIILKVKKTIKVKLV